MVRVLNCRSICKLRLATSHSHYPQILILKQIEAAERQIRLQFVHALKPFIERQVATVPREKAFPEAKAAEDPGRFRGANEPIGAIWDFSLSGHINGHNVTLAKGPCTWLRLMPTFDPQKTWAARELRDAGRTGAILQPFIFSSLFILRAEDGVAACNLTTASSSETNSVAFAFETGEVWAIDTWALAIDRSKLPVLYVEQYWPQRLENYAEFLGRLGLHGPYQWMAGVSGARNRRLQYPPKQGYMWPPDWNGPECLAEHIAAKGTYNDGESPGGALLPFFELIFQKSGERRPNYLPL